jgi:hypothetical protein
MKRSPWQSFTSSRNSRPFMKPEGSLLCSQKSTTGPCPELHQSNLHPISSKSTSMLFFHLRLCLPSCLLALDFSSETSYAFSICHTPVTYQPRYPVLKHIANVFSLRVRSCLAHQHHRNILFRTLELVLFTSEAQIQSTHIISNM